MPANATAPIRLSAEATEQLRVAADALAKAGKALAQVERVLAQEVRKA